MTRVLAVAAHPDDETLGCGGTLLRHREAGDSIYWLIVTGMSPESGWSPVQISTRAREIDAVAKLFDFAQTIQLGLPPGGLDALPLADIVKHVASAIQSIQPEVVYLPFSGDAHSDHRVAFAATSACLKIFRAAFVRRILAYETLSETDFGIDPSLAPFRPNVFVNIERWFAKKESIMEVFSSELGTFPFPRSIEAMRAQAALRGTAAGCRAAECFMLLKDIIA